MAESLEARDGAVVSSAGEPGPLSRLLQELADASGDDALGAWKRELQPGDAVGRFEIRREVGRGGFGAVYEAFDTQLNRVVAVKTLRLSRPRQDLSSDWIKKEAEAVARLDHPCIVTLFDVGTCDSGPYLVMELLRGKTLAQRIAEGPVPVAEALRIAEEMAKGLAHAHSRGVLHRDLKPANVFVCEDGRVKLLDFGLAHLLGTEGVSGAGTPAYMAPEQARGEEVDQRADVYAAGRVLGEVLGERRPRRLDRAIALAASTDPAARPRDGQAWLDLLQMAKHAVERPARMRRIALLAGLGIVLGGVVVGVAVHRASRPVAAAHGKPSIAVLAFKNLSADQDQEYFSDGVAEEILNALARVPGLWVPGRTSSFYFKGKDAKLEDIGRELKVDHVLEGSVRRSGSKVRVTAEVVNVATGDRVWSQSFDREFTDIFTVQEDIARATAAALQVKLNASPVSPSSRTANPEAYNEYLLGTQFMRQFSEEGFRRADEAFRRSIRLDPDYAPAWVGLAQALMRGNHAADQGASSRDAAERAVLLGPTLPDAWTQRARSKRLVWDWEGAAADLKRAQELAPGRANQMEALLHRDMGRLDEAIRVAADLTRQDPLAPEFWWHLGALYMWAGRYAEARRAYERTAEVSPEHVWLQSNLRELDLLEGRPAVAIAECQKAMKERIDKKQSHGSCAWVEALAYHSLGNDAESRKSISLLEDRQGWFGVAQARAWRGESNLAFDALNRALERRQSSLRFIKLDPFLRSIRSDPRFAEVLRKMNLPVE